MIYKFLKKIFSISFFIISILLAISIITFNTSNNSIYSTGFSSVNSLFYLYNSFIIILYNLLNYSFYLLIPPLLSWSIKLWINKPVYFFKQKIVILIFLVSMFSYFLQSNHLANSIIGLFLYYQLSFITTSLDIVFLLFLVVLYLFTTSISIKEWISILYFKINLFTSTLDLIILYTKLIINSLLKFSKNILSKKVQKTHAPNKKIFIKPSKVNDFNTFNFQENSLKSQINNDIPQDAENNINFKKNFLKDLLERSNTPTISKYNSKVFKKNQEEEEEESIIDKEDTNNFIEKTDKPENIQHHQTPIKTDSNYTHRLKEQNETYQQTPPPKSFFENHTTKIITNNKYSIPINLFNKNPIEQKNINSNEIKSNAIKLEQIMLEFGIKGKITGYQTGPVVTLYEISIPPGIKSAKLIALEKDIALRMKANSVRIAIIPGRDVIGLEYPNQKRQTVFIRNLLETHHFKNKSLNLPLILGDSINGSPIIADLSTMPHLLIAGTTGSGKSVSVNAMILSLLYGLSPDECKFIMIDPKMLELSIYQDIPHLLTPVVTDPKQALQALKWAVREMENRYRLMSLLGVRNIKGFNEKIQNEKEIEEIKQKLEEQGDYDTSFSSLPYIVVVIDEMADLMLTSGKDVESAVQRLAQMARASGIHLIMATQRPSVDVITGTIKANFPTRISFQVSSPIDSRTILGTQGAEQLLGKGDMLYMPGVGRIQRVHGPFVSDKEVEDVVTHLKSLGSPNYIESIFIEDSQDPAAGISSEENKDALYNEVINIMKQDGKFSISYIQRKLQIGYNRAARIIEQLEDDGVISKPNSLGKRELL
jgi:DNA segregation ATPase FtsK/SpoIIIE-like protein